MIIKFIKIFLCFCFVYANGFSKDWRFASEWKQNGKNYEAVLQSENIASKCKKNQKLSLIFPPIIQGAQKVYLNNKLLASFGDSKFNFVQTYYGNIEISCRDILDKVSNDNIKIEWHIFSFVKDFTKFQFYPYVGTKTNLNFINEVSFVIAAGVLFVFSLFCFIVFYNKVDRKTLYSLFFSSIFTSIFFMVVTSKYFNFSFPMLYAHKIGDSSLLIGCFLFLSILKRENYIHKVFFKILTGLIFLGIIIIIIGKNGDEVQMGTSLTFTGLTIVMFMIIFNIFKNKIFKKRNRRSIFHAVALIIYCSCSIYDMLAVSGLLSPYFVYGFGMCTSLLFMALSVNERIIKTYEERDYLRKNLELEVERKTLELSEKTNALSIALENLQEKEAGLIQAEKLASLGTLSAGIAHEINNSLNYVNGSLRPIEKLIINDELLEETKKKKILSLTGMMKEGLDTTFDIIKSLKNYTGLNQSAWKEVNLLETINSTLLMLKGKINKEVDINLNIDPNINFYANVVGIGQIFTNLIINSMDAMNGKGVIDINAIIENDFVVIKLIDEGKGIPKSILPKIFDPFFTTKDVGKGTGLGLYIVKNEIDKHEGQIEIKPIENIGTTFILKFPIDNLNSSKKDLAS